MPRLEKMKVLLIAPSPDLAGGISRWTKHILNYYKEHTEDCNLDYLCSAYYKHSIKNSFWTKLYSGLSVLLRFIRKASRLNYDVVHITTSASIGLIKDICLVKIAKRYSVKSVIHFHFGRIPELCHYKNWEWKLLKILVDNSDVVITIDQKSYLSLLASGFKNVVNLLNPLSNKILESIDRKSFISIQPRTITFVGQMLETKGIYELVEVCSQISGIQLNMYGSLPKGVKEKLIVLSGKNNKWLNVVGEIDYSLIVDKMMASAIFVLPTYTEGFPNVILESMACGCAIIASCVGAIPEMLAIDTERPCGICVEPKNKVQLKQAIEYMLSNPMEAKTLGNRARERVIKEYSIDSVWNRMINIWIGSKMN